MDKHVEAMCDIAGFGAGPVTAQLFGNAGMEHNNKYGSTPEHLAKIAYKNHKHSVNNPWVTLSRKCRFYMIFYTWINIKNIIYIYCPEIKYYCILILKMKIL